MEYSVGVLLAAAGVIFVAYLVRGITGFGSGLISIPLLALMFPLKIVVPIIVLLDLIGSGAQAAKNWHHTDWKVLIPLLPATIVGILWALYFFHSADTETLSLALGIFVIFFAIYQLLPTPELNAGKLSAIPMGLCGGLLGTLFGTGGPFYVIYLSMRGLGKQEFRASYSVYFMIDGIVRVLVYIFGLSLIRAEWLSLFLMAFVPFAAGLYVGGKVHQEIPAIIFKRLISLILVASGSALILQN